MSLEQRIAKLEEASRETAEVQAEALKAVGQISEMFGQMRETLTTQRILIVNAEGQAVLEIGASDGEGQPGILIRNAAGRLVALMGVDHEGGTIAVSDHNGHPRATLQVLDGAGRVSTFAPDGTAHAFGP